MKKNYFTYALVFALMGLTLFSSCSKDDEETSTTTTTTGSKEVILSSAITGTRSLVKDSVYILQGQINVSGVINIAAGTVIKGDKVTKGCMVIVPGGKIHATGTATSPIVFTSRQDAGERAAGDWGGLVICGKAKINQSTASVEGLTSAVTYSGGTDDADNSGELQYARIEFAGIALEPDKEINGLTLCAVGSGTTIDHIQVSYSGDDSFEWFGGDVNAKYLIAYLGLDDDFDTDFGFRGKVQFGLGVRNPRVADVSTSNGFESDNDATGSTNTPQTAPVFCNMTLVGPYKTTADKNVNANYGAGMHIRRNSSLSVYNSVIAGWNTAGFLLDGSLTYANATAGTLAVKNCAIVGAKVIAVKGDGTGCTNTQAQDFFNTTAFANTIIADNATAGIADAFFLVSTGAKPVNFLPTTGSTLLSAASFTGLASFFSSTSYIGAFGTSDWTSESWTNFDPQNTVY